MIMVVLAHGQQVIRLDLKVATVGITIIESIATLNLQFPYCNGMNINIFIEYVPYVL